MRRILSLGVFSLAVAVGGTSPVGGQDPGGRPDLPPPPASFDARTITVPLYGTAPDADDWVGTSALDGSDVRWAAPAREGAVRVGPDRWVQSVHSGCGLDGASRALELVRPGEAPVPLVTRVADRVHVAAGSVWVGRMRRDASVGSGIWEVPVDGRPARLRLRIRDPELFSDIVVSEDGRRIALAPYLGQFRPYDSIAPRTRLRIGDGPVVFLDRWLGVAGWDAGGGLILDQDHIRRWDPATGRVSRIDRPGDLDEAHVLPGGEHVVVYARSWSFARTRIGIIDPVTGKRRDVAVDGGDWYVDDDMSTASTVVLTSFGDVVDAAGRALLALVDVRDGWVGFLPYPPAPSAIPYRGVLHGLDGTPRPPTWFAAGSIRYMGSPTGDMEDLADGLWSAAIDGSAMHRLSDRASHSLTLRTGAVAWVQGPRRPGGLRTMMVADGSTGTRMLADRLTADPLMEGPGRTLWAWREDARGGRALWSIPIGGGSPRPIAVVPADASDVVVDPRGDRIAWARPDGSFWSWARGASTRRERRQIIGLPCGGGALVRDESGIMETWGDDETDRDTLLAADPGLDVTVSRSGALIVVGPTGSTDGNGMRLIIHRDPHLNGPRVVTLSSGFWESTLLGTDRYVVLRDRGRDRFGVYDTLEHWFAEVPFVPVAP